MKLCFRRPKDSEYDTVYNFYSELIDTSPYIPNWKMGYCPDEETLKYALETGKLVFGEVDGKPVAAVIASDMVDYTSLELLGVLPAYRGNGFARKMVEKVIAQAKLRNHGGVRLEVLEGNTAAEALYVSMGFKHVKSYSVAYERTGKMVFKVYEYVI